MKIDEGYGVEDDDKDDKEDNDDEDKDDETRASGGIDSDFPKSA